MTDAIEPAAYNYTVFEGQGDYETFPVPLHALSRAPDGVAVLLESGREVRLSDYWGERDVLIEFGSYT
jgi:hypothetical protein